VSRFNVYMSQRFEGCRCIANARDPHRGRDVKVYAVPGEFDLVGVSDGTDVWIAPVAADPFSVSVKRIMEIIKEGGVPPPIARQRHRIVVAPEVTIPAKKERVRVHA
jgi:hypothetical protein